MVKKAKKVLKKQTTSIASVSLKLTDWVGTPMSVVFHTIFFIGSFALILLGFDADRILLVLTTAVSLEAIYLAIFIQMTVNRNTKSLEEVEADIDEIQEDVEDLEEEFDEISEDIDEIQEEEKLDEVQDKQTNETLDRIQSQLGVLLKELEQLKIKDSDGNTK